MSETNNLDIFNLSTESLINPPKKKSADLYQPSADKGKDGIYKALIRFLPNVRNAEKSKIMKYYVWMVDPVTNESYSVDCPSTVGKKSILKDTYWKLKNSASARDQELAQEKFSRNESYYSFVQIVKDPNEPDLEGKVMVFKFGSKINQKIEKLLKPEFGAPINPYDVFEGKLFALHIVKKQKWNNYDLCEFVGERTPMEIEKVAMTKTKEDMAKIVDFLKDQSPDLEKYEYREWDQAMHDKVVQSIRNIVPDQKLVEQLIGAAAEGSTHAGGFDAKPKKKEELFEEPKKKAEPAAEAHQEEAPKKAPGKVSSIDDLYENL
jgi:hypothetical protein